MEEEGRRRKKRRRRKGNGGGRECGEGGNELLRMSVEVVQSAFIERAYRNCKERERDWRMILKYFLCPQYGEYTHNMSYILDFLDVICILFGSKNVNMSVHIIYLHVIYIYRAMYRNEGEK